MGTEGHYLDENGQWFSPERSGYTIELFSNIESEVSVTLKDGVVTGVTVTRQAETDTFLWLSNTESEIALLALAGSLPEINCITCKGEDWLATMEQQTDLDYDLSVRGLLHITQSTELNGFEDMGDSTPF